MQSSQTHTPQNEQTTQKLTPTKFFGKKCWAHNNFQAQKILRRKFLYVLIIVRVHFGGVKIHL